jgi:hypothetical protein
MDRKGRKVGSIVGRWILNAIGLRRDRSDEEPTTSSPGDLPDFPGEFQAVHDPCARTTAELSGARSPPQVRHSAGTTLSDRDRFLGRIKGGMSTGFDRSRPGAAEQVVIGLDFGTSASKVVLRAPYNPSAPTHAVPVPKPLQPESNPHLCGTAIWLLPSGVFHLWPVEDAVRVDGIKTALMSGSPQAPIGNTSSGPSACAIDACIAYLAYLFRYARGWFLEAKGEAYGYRHIDWMTNVGLPAATYDNSKLLATYRQCVAAAWLLSGNNMEINIGAVREAFFDSRSVDAATKNSNAREFLGIEVIPEVAAEVTGFARSTRRRDGLYILIDVGAATLDACSFRLYAPNGVQDRYSMFTADVQLLGVESVRSRLQMGESDEQLRHEIAFVAKKVIWDTKCRRDPRAAEWRGELPVFLCGGGSANEIHKLAVKELTGWLTRHVGARLRLLSLESPENMDASTGPSDFHRLAVAAGLSYPPFDIGTLALPTEIVDIARLPVRDNSNRYLSKDDV